jgi:hypothetical protein
MDTCILKERKGAEINFPELVLLAFGFKRRFNHRPGIVKPISCSER